MYKPDPFKFHHSLEFSQTDGDDRPAEAPKFLNADILWNPFEDITLRSTKEEREAEAALKRWPLERTFDASVECCQRMRRETINSWDPKIFVPWRCGDDALVICCDGSVTSQV